MTCRWNPPRAGAGVAPPVLPRFTVTWFTLPAVASTPGAWPAEPVGEAVYEHLLTSFLKSTV